MFTGIVEATAMVQSCKKGRLVLACPPAWKGLKTGSSVCVSGVCLSTVKVTKDSMVFDVVSETLKRTRLGGLRKGDRLNLERALKASARIEGHLVQGHVDGVGQVRKGSKEGTEGKVRMEGVTLTITYPKHLRGLIVEKGSVAVDGVSLTVASISKDSFTVALIPHTLKVTTLGKLREGDLVNLETDILGKYARERG